MVNVKDKAIKRIAYTLECGFEHTSDAEAWKTPAECRQAFYYAYSSISYICACIWTKATGVPTEAETFTELLYDPPKLPWENAVRNLLGE